MERLRTTQHQEKPRKERNILHCSHTHNLVTTRIGLFSVSVVTFSVSVLEQNRTERVVACSRTEHTPARGSGARPPDGGMALLTPLTIPSYVRAVCRTCTQGFNCTGRDLFESRVHSHTVSSAHRESQLRASRCGRACSVQKVPGSSAWRIRDDWRVAHGHTP